MVKENVTVCEDLPATRLAQGIVNDTAVTCPKTVPGIVPVGAYVVVQSLLVVTDTPQVAVKPDMIPLNVRPHSVMV